MSRTMKKIHIKQYSDDFILPENILKKELKKRGRTIKLEPLKDRKQNKNKLKYYVSIMANI